MNESRTLLSDWSLRSGKNKVVLLIVILASLGLFAVPIIAAPMTAPIVSSIGLGAYCLVWIALMLGIVFIHEGLHGLLFWAYSRKVTFGVRWWTSFGPAPYASSPDSLFTKRQYQLIALAPQFLTALLFILGLILFNSPASGILLISATANLAGGCVDIWSIFYIQRLPKNALFEDTKDGFRTWQG